MKIPNYSPQVECQSVHPYLNLSFNSRNGVRKRHRTHFTNQQVEKLESIFKQTANPNRDLVVQLSTLLNLTDKNISIWFKNRRAKSRREQTNQKETRNGLTENVTKSEQKPSPLLVNETKSSWTEQNIYPNYPPQKDTSSDVKHQSISYPHEDNAYLRPTSYVSEHPLDAGSDKASYLKPSCYGVTENVKTMNQQSFANERNTSSICSTDYVKSTSKMENSQSSKSTNEPITPPLPTDLPREEPYPWNMFYSTGTRHHSWNSNLYVSTPYSRGAFYSTDPRNLSWNSSVGHSSNYAGSVTSSIDSNSLANTSDSSSASSLSSSQENESSPWLPHSSSQHTLASSSAYHHVPQTTDTYQYSKPGSQIYQCATSSTNEKMAAYGNVVPEFNFPSLISSLSGIQ